MLMIALFPTNVTQFFGGIQKKPEKAAFPKPGSPVRTRKNGIPYASGLLWDQIATLGRVCQVVMSMGSLFSKRS